MKTGTLRISRLPQFVLAVFAGLFLSLVPSSANAGEATDSGNVYVVKKGDTLGGIALQHEVSETALRAANPGIKDPDIIQTGQRLTLPPLGTGLARYEIDPARKDSGDDFNAFLRRCSLEERACLMQSLMGLDDFKLAKHHFGKLKNVKDWDAYADKEKKASKEKPIRPKTFNDVPPATVVDAIDRGILPESCVSPSAIRKELLWNCCNKLRYHGLNDKKVNYHKEALQWVCGKHDLSKVQIDTLSTFDLEKKFVEKYFEEIWDKLTPQQRTELLGKIETSSKSTIANKAGIAAMSGGAAIAALGTTVAFTGFAFYTTMSTVIATVAGWVGATLPFAAYTGASTTVAVFAGPVGWCIAGAGLLGGAIAAGWPDSQKTANFVITVHLIKSKWAEKHVLQAVEKDNIDPDFALAVLYENGNLASPASREEKIRKLPIGAYQDQLAAIACTDPFGRVRLAAVEKLQNQADLVRVAESEPEAVIRAEAVRKIEDRNILKIFLDDKSELVRRAAAR